LEVYNYYQLPLICQPTPVRFNSVIHQLRPSGEGMVS
jgi:hypothetical protein